MPVEAEFPALDQPVAVVGMACRFPGAPDPDAFWRLLRDGVDAVTTVPASRPELAGLGRRRGGFLDRIDEFDPDFFGISPREAAAADPQQRLALELSWEALEDSGIVPAALSGSGTGVFLGAIWDDYARIAAGYPVTHSTMTGASRAMIANRVSYTLGLRGPSLVVDSAQSSSLVAVQLACESLRRGESEVALAGGVSLIVSPDGYPLAEKFGALSPDGRAYTFDERANGYVRGEGGGVVVLKALSQAIADGDRVHGVILGGAVNNDGGGEGLTVPRQETQEEVLRTAYRRAGVDAAEVRFVELHGTGTPVGDPIEAAALGAVLGSGRKSPLLVGSVKTNIGHLEGAAGIAGLLKAILCLRENTAVPSLNFRTPNSRIPLRRWGLEVNGVPRPLGEATDRPVAGVSSFGMGGTNCHLVLSGWPANIPETEPASPPVPVLVSGKTSAAVRAQADRLLSRLPDNLSGLGRALATTRTHFEHRAAVVTDDEAGLVRGLTELANGRTAPGVVAGVADEGRMAYLFSGQGSQRAGMGRELREKFPVFSTNLDEICAEFDKHLDQPLRDVILGDLDGIDQTKYTQPALFAFETALFRLLESWGLRPDVVLGHSVGELAAAHVAGVFSLADACTLVAARGRLMQSVSRAGAMVAIQATEEEVAASLAEYGGRVATSAVNGPQATVVAGDTDAVMELAAAWKDRGRKTTRLRVSHAFHSPHMDGVLDEFREVAASLAYGAPAIPVVSNVTGKVLTDEEAASPDYWARHVRGAVRFLDGVRALAEFGVSKHVEIGPDAVLTAMAQACGVSDGAFIATARSGRPEVRSVVEAVARLHVRGVSVEWERLLGRTGSTPVSLPTYAFQRERCWLGDVPAARPAEQAGTAARDVEAVVRSQVSAVLGHRSPETLDLAKPFKDLGFDSLMGVELHELLTDSLGVRLPATLVYDYPSPALLIRSLNGVSGEPAEPVRAAAAGDDPVVIVGMGCRLPGGVRSPEEFWELVRSGGDAITEFPADRGWELDRLFDPDPGHAGTSATRFGGFLDGAGDFDAEFFDISPREAQSMDPQQRVLLETSWEVFERAGIDPLSLRGSQTGVFAGAFTYRGQSGASAGREGERMTGGAASVLSGRVSYAFGFEGPAVTVDTACSSSLVALHLAVQSLRSGECSLALAGGVTVMSTPDTFVEFSRQRGLSADGRCKSFGAGADGTGWAEGVALLLLERLSDARRSGHQVLGVIRGSAVNQDGASNGLTAPNGPSQQRVIRAALGSGGLTTADVDVVEAHGTGTRLGDPVEAQAILATYGQDRPADRPLRLGSAKSNIGHTQAASGVAGVIKMVLSMRHGLLPRTLHARERSPFVDWSAGAVELLTEEVAWPAGDRPRRAGVSSFGISGTNAHVIVEEPPEAALPAVLGTGGPQLPVLVSAKSPDALAALAEKLAVSAETATREDLAFSLATSRAALPHRAALLSGSRDEIVQGLRTLDGNHVLTGSANNPGKLAFLFSGQGSQRAGMGRELAVQFPLFARELDEIGELLGLRLRDEVLGDGELLDQTRYTQPALFAFEVALYRLVESWGLEPAFLLGHSVGEIAAAHVSGILSLGDACTLVAARGRLMQELPAGGGMLAVQAAEEDVLPVVRAEDVDIAAVNGPQAVVVSGPSAALDRVARAFAGHGRRTKRLRVSHAFHSRLMDPMIDEFREVVAGLEFRTSNAAIVSAVTGELATAELSAPEYWVRHVKDAVRFADGVKVLRDRDVTAFLEIGPDAVLTAMAQETLDDPDSAFVATTRREQPEAATLMRALARCWVGGAEVDWRAVHDGRGGRRVDLPTYPFQHRNYWPSAAVRRPGDPVGAGLEPSGHPLLGAVFQPAGTGEIVLTGRVELSGQPWLADHAVLGRVVFPGAGLVDLALAAGRRAGCAGLAELTLEAPLLLPAEGGVQVQARAGEPDETGQRPVTVHSRPDDGEWTRHAAGVLAPDPLAGTDLAEWPPPGCEEVGLDSWYDALAAQGFDYGPAFQGLRKVWRGGAEVFAELEVADHHADGFVVHPALLDSALHAIELGALPASAETRLPFAWAGVQAHARSGPAARARITAAGSDAVSLELADAAGRPLLTVRSLARRPVTAAQLDPGNDSLFRVDWTPVAGRPRSVPAAWNLLGTDELDLRSAGILAAGETPCDVTVLTLAAKPGDAAEVTHAEARRILSTVRDWLADERFAASRLVVVTSGAVAAHSEEDVPDLAHAAVLGLLRSAATENPGRITLIDIDDDPRSRKALLAAVGSAEGQLAIRAGTVLMPRLAKAAAAASFAWNPGGTVLITGGTGSLGRLISRHLVVKHQVRRLLITSRSGVDPEFAGELAELGAEAVFEACDMAERAAVEDLLARHRVTAIVHTAGVLDDGLLAGLTPSRLASVLRPKVDAAWHLHELTADRPLDAFVLFSSIQGLVGGAGQANYAAANAFLDALAQHRAARGLAATALAWGPWAEGGMAAGLGEADRARFARAGMAQLRPEKGLELFDAAIGAGSAAVPLALAGAVPSGAEPPNLLRSVVRVPDERIDQRDRPGGEALLAKLAGRPEAEQEKILLALVRAEVAATLDYGDPDEVDAERGFKELGLDSLTAVELRNRVNKATRLRLPATVVFDHPTPARLAGRLRAELAPDSPDAGASAGPENRDARPGPSIDPGLIDSLDVDALIRMAGHNIES